MRDDTGFWVCFAKGRMKKIPGYFTIITGTRGVLITGQEMVY